MACNCEGKNYNISMGCCEPVLAPIQNYYTKYQIDKMIESATTSGCCITPEEVDEKIEEAISGITQSGVTEEEMNEAIASAKTEIEAEIPTVPTSNTAFTNDAGYLTEHQHLKTINGNSLVGEGDIEIGTGGTIDLSNYYTTAQTETAISSAVSGKADTTYVQNNYINKNQIQCVSEAEWSHISGSTQADTLYLVY